MKNGKWAAVFGNGYNNTEADGAASTTGNAVLYIAFIEDGLDGWSAGDFIKLDTGAGTTTSPNGLATPAPVDVDGDRIIDYIYAGDLLGKERGLRRQPAVCGQGRRRSAPAHHHPARGGRASREQERRYL
jgi:hypothetical protein